MAKNKYMMKVSLSVNGVNKLLKFSKVLQKDMPTLEKRFVEKSLAFIQERANEYIKATTGNSDWYVLTHQLENSWVVDLTKKTLRNICPYSAFVEYGTGVVGAGTHPESGDYQYDENGHGDSGWFFFDNEGTLHWTRGMEAHAYLYNAVSDYYYKGEAERILDELINKMLRKAV